MSKDKEKNLSLEDIKNNIRNLFKEKKLSLEEVKLEKEFWKKKFWEKYDKHIQDGKCQFLGGLGLCYRQAVKGCECFICDNPSCYICHKNFTSFNSTKDCLFCFADDYSDFKYFIKIYFDEKNNKLLKIEYKINKNKKRDN